MLHQAEYRDGNRRALVSKNKMTASVDENEQKKSLPC